MQEFDILITTRNRADILKVSLALMLREQAKPRHLIVVDSSDDHDEVREIVQNLASQNGINFSFIKSGPGIAFQRNVGLQYVKAPVVMIPDDDSLWYPGYAEEIMRIYERDRSQDIGCVFGYEVPAPPPSFTTAEKPYGMGWKDIFSGKQRSEFVSLSKFFPDPVGIELRSKLRMLPIPEWLREEEAAPDVNFSGFKASFRSDLVKSLKYDETLGTYSLLEDRELLIRLMDTHLAVCARRAKVHHYRFPGNRTNPIEWGAIHVLNRAYIISKHSPPGSLSRKAMKRYCIYKLARYIGQAYNKDGRMRVMGTWCGLRRLRELMRASREELPQVYDRARCKCVSNSSQYNS